MIRFQYKKIERVNHQTRSRVPRASNVSISVFMAAIRSAIPYRRKKQEFPSKKCLIKILGNFKIMSSCSSDNSLIKFCARSRTSNVGPKAKHPKKGWSGLKKDLSFEF